VGDELKTGATNIAELFSFLGFDMLKRLLATSARSLGAHVSLPSNAYDTNGEPIKKNKRQLAIKMFFPKVKIIMINAGF